MTDIAEPLVILSLKAENFKRLKAIEITPDGEMVILNGANRQGKTSILDGIWGLIVGDSVIQSDPIRHGQETALLQGNLGPKGGPAQFTVTRKFRKPKEGSPKKYTTELIVTSPDGARFPSPQSVLNGLLGIYSFDPKKFVDMPDNERVEVLKGFVTDFDFAANKRLHDTAFEDRRETKRKAKDARTRVASISIQGNVASDAEPISEDDLVAEMQAAGEHNAEIMSRRERRAQAHRDVETQSRSADEHFNRAKLLRKEADDLDKQGYEILDAAKALATQLSEAPELPEPIDVTTISAKISTARAFNELVRKVKAKAELEHEAANLEQAVAIFDNKIEELVAARVNAIKAAKLPVEGMEFGPDGVTLNGVTFDQASDEEQLSASVRVAAAMHPKLGIIRIRDGSLLDKNNRRLLAEFAKENKLQVWMEVVDEASEVGIIIEDGSVKQPAPASEPEGALL
jgi:hypothetical protein